MMLEKQPIEAELPREIVKKARFYKTDAGYKGIFTVFGGLKDENQGAFDSYQS